jgi:hypothetical protein
VSDPYNPHPISGLLVEGSCLIDDAIFNGSYAYLLGRELLNKAHYSAKFWTVDISDPTNPALLDLLEITPPGDEYWPEGNMARRGEVIFLGGGNLGLCAIDISDPALPDLLVQINEPGPRFLDVAVKRDRLFVCLINGIGVYDISDPSSPELVQYIPVGSHPVRSYLDGDKLCVTAHQGFYIFDINFPTTECGDIDWSGSVDIDDIVALIQFVFTGGTPPDPVESGDVNCSGGVDIDDIVYLIAYVFQGGEEPCAGC